MRPVQPIHNSPIANLDILVLTQVRSYLTYRIDNTQQIREKIKDYGPIKNGDFLFSLDVKQMYPSLPTCDEALMVIRKKLQKHAQHIDFFNFKLGHIMEFLKFIWENSYIEVNEKVYKQSSGVGTGGHSSPGVADILIDDMYMTAIEIEKVLPGCLSLYVDDSIGIWTESLQKYQQFISTLNNTWPTVEFESTLEDSNREIVFLDIKIKIEEEYNITYEFHQKPTHCNRYLDYLSHTPEQTKINIVLSEARRIINNCSHIEKSYPHLEKLRKHLINSNYPTQLINKYITMAIENPIPKIKSKAKDEYKNSYLIRIPYMNEPFTRIVKKHVKKSKLNIKVVVKAAMSIKRKVTSSPSNCKCQSCKNKFPCTSRDMVYQATCKFCKESYLGATGRMGDQRFKEHEASVRRENDASSIGKHILDKHSQIDSYEVRDINNYYEFSILKHCKDTFEAFLSEDILIKTKKPAINNMTGNGFTF